MKIAMPLAVAAWSCVLSPASPSVTLTALLICLSAAIATQPDLGTAILVAASGGFVVFMAGISWWQLCQAPAALACIWPAWLFLLRTTRSSASRLFDPDADRLGAAEYHPV